MAVLVTEGVVRLENKPWPCVQNIKPVSLGARVQSVPCFPHRHEDLALISRTHVNADVVCVYNPSPGEAETRRFKS